jgi:hypothetical protein
MFSIASGIQYWSLTFLEQLLHSSHFSECFTRYPINPSHIFEVFWMKGLSNRAYSLEKQCRLLVKWTSFEAQISGFEDFFSSFFLQCSGLNPKYLGLNPGFTTFLLCDLAKFCVLCSVSPYISGIITVPKSRTQLLLLHLS